MVYIQENKASLPLTSKSMMMRTEHVLSEVDPVAKRAICALCGPAVIFTRINYSGTIGTYCVRPVSKRTRWNRLHVLSDLDPITKIANCSVCGPARTHTRVNGKTYCIGPPKVRTAWKILHPLSNIDTDEKVADCSACGARVSIQKRRYKGDKDYYICAHGRRGQDVYRLAKGTECDRCGFIPEHWCQLDVDHIDGNHKNHDANNLQTLCSNCHRMKTYTERQGIFRKMNAPRKDGISNR